MGEVADEEEEYEEPLSSLKNSPRDEQVQRNRKANGIHLSNEESSKERTGDLKPSNKRL